MLQLRPLEPQDCLINQSMQAAIAELRQFIVLWVAYEGIDSIEKEDSFWKICLIARKNLRMYEVNLNLRAIEEKVLSSI